MIRKLATLILDALLALVACPAGAHCLLCPAAANRPPYIPSRAPKQEQARSALN
jgi:hypothetical protein